MFCPNGIGGGPRGCRAVGLLDPVGFSLMGGSTRAFSSRGASGMGNGSGTVCFEVFVESASGGAPSESEES